MSNKVTVGGSCIWPVQRPPQARGLRLVTTAAEYILIDSERNTMYLTRSPDHECVVSRTSSTGADSPRSDKGGTPILGVLGVVELFSGPYLLVISDAEKVGTLAGCHDVYRIGDPQHPF
eukprot:SAG31_NODE_23315_length_506_cov_1.906634_1_plen_119_part_00